MNKKLLLALLGGCLLLCCCLTGIAGAIYFFNKSQPLSQPDKILPTTRPSVAISKTATPSPTQTPIIAKPLSGGFIETFDDNSNDWQVGDLGGEYIYINTAIEEGKMVYETEALKEDGGFTYDTYYDHPLSDFEASIDAEMIQGQEDTSFGMIFNRIDNMNFYYFLINPKYQEFELRKFMNDEGSSLIDWTSSNAIKSYGVNNIRIKKAGPQITLYINDVEVSSIKDDTFKEPGDIGFIIAHFSLGDSATIEFDNLRIVPK